MKPEKIKVGKTYVNRGAGRTKRTVLAIGKEHRPKMFFNDTGVPKNTDEDGVLYEQKGVHRNLYLCSFSKWAGKEAV